MPVWLSIVLALGGSAVISTVVGFVLNHQLKKAYDKKDHDREELNKLHAMEEQTARRKAMEEALAPLLAELGQLTQQIDKIASGTKCTLRNDITVYYYRCKDKGYRNDKDYTNMHDMYEAYLALNGNSYIADIMQRFDDLPPKEKVEKEDDDD